jgi:putative permease|tara:strand:- start:233 stop:1285 length:1053 start_codon:yes stop_codon:yes gene_type:complete
MLTIFNKWFNQLFGDEESLILLLLLIGGVTLVVLMGAILAPLIAAVIFAFLLQGVDSLLRSWGFSERISLWLCYAIFISIFVISLIFIMPLVWNQLVNLFAELPRMLIAVKKAVIALEGDLFSKEQLSGLLINTSEQVAGLGQWVVSFSLSNISNIIGILIYIIIVPILVFFLLMDRDVILTWSASFLPKRRPLMQKIWAEMNNQVANYARGKAIEIIVVGMVSYIAFLVLGLNYAALLAMLVGLSVVIPYIGAAVVTVPVLLVGFVQWGWGSDFAYLFFTYMIIQALDGNVLVPLLFSEAVNLHPVAIILAVLFFGGIWGLWGVFFAIPLATLIKALINAWPAALPASN